MANNTGSQITEGAKMNKQKDRDEFLVIMALELHNKQPYTIAKDSRELMRLAKRHHRLQEDYCNGLRQEGDKATDRNEKRITTLATALNMKAYFSGDPRGCTVKLIVPSGFSDSWDHEGICVPQH